MNLQKRYFDIIENGEKVVEGRLAKEKYRNLKVGDRIIFNTDLERKIEKTISCLYIFETFRDAFKELDFKKAIPDAENKEEAIKIYENFYPIAEQEKFNIIL